MGILDTHEVEIKKILKRVNGLQKELMRLYRESHCDQRSIDYDEAAIRAYTDAIATLLGEDGVITCDDDNRWHIYMRWD